MADRAEDDKVSLPLVAKASLAWSIATALSYPLLLWAFFGARTSTGESAMLDFWRQGGLVDRASIIVMAIVVLGIPLEMFRARTVFAQDQIQHIPAFGRSQIFRYEDVMDVEVFEGEFARLVFRNGKRVKIWEMCADPAKVAMIVRRQRARKAEKLRGEV